MLQAVELEQGWAATQLEIREEQAYVRERVTDEDGTRLKAPVVIRSQGGASGLLVEGVPGAGERRVDGATAFDGTVHRRAEESGGVTVHRSPHSGGVPGELIGAVGSRPLGLVGAPV